MTSRQLPCGRPVALTLAPAMRQAGNREAKRPERQPVDLQLYLYSTLTTVTTAGGREHGAKRNIWRCEGGSDIGAQQAEK